MHPGQEQRASGLRGVRSLRTEFWSRRAQLAPGAWACTRGRAGARSLQSLASGRAGRPRPRGRRWALAGRPCEPYSPGAPLGLEACPRQMPPPLRTKEGTGLARAQQGQTREMALQLLVPGCRPLMIGGCNNRGSPRRAQRGCESTVNTSAPLGVGGSVCEQPSHMSAFCHH